MHAELDPAVVDSLFAGADRLTDTVVDRIRAEVGFYLAGGSVSRDALRQSVDDNVMRVLQQFAGGGLAAALQAPRTTGRERALQGAPLPEVLSAYRIGFGCFWEELVALARAGSWLGDSQLVDLAADIWRMSGEYADTMVSGYREASAQLMLQREHERSVLVEALFAGFIDGQRTLWETAEILRLPLEGDFVVVAAETPAIGRQALADIESRLEAEAVRSAWRLLPHEQIGVVCSRSVRMRERALQVLGRQAVSRIGVSRPFTSLRETPQALQFARLARGTLPAGEAGLARFEDTAPLAVLVAAAPAEAERVVSTILGPLRELPAEDCSLLISTLDAWFTAAGSAADTAQAMYCHPNTVRYRLRRLETLTGRSLHNPQDVADLATALQTARIVLGLR